MRSEDGCENYALYKKTSDNEVGKVQTICNGILNI